ncbi:MAG TPA: hypothetical protein VK970_12005, partial [Candidatus Methylacidiphilales bacterium]|nr:hypothetical protein [Candidatus Methylacidiphilales bacterium]
ATALAALALTPLVSPMAKLHAQAQQWTKSKPDYTLKDKLSAIVIPEISFKEISLPDAFRAVAAAGKAADPTKEGFNLVVSAEVETQKKDTKITLDLQKKSVVEVLQFLSHMGSVEVAYDEFAVVVSPLPKGGK